MKHDSITVHSVKTGSKPGARAHLDLHSWGQLTITNQREPNSFSCCTYISPFLPFTYINLGATGAQTFLGRAQNPG